MNDVTITELGDGALVVRALGYSDLVLLPEVAAALREHFAAEHDAALVAERDAEKWDEGWQQGFRDYQARQYDSEGHAVIMPTPNPYRVTPSTELNHTEEPPC